MKPLNHCLLAAACVLLPVFTASRCAAQDTDRLLHAGMLGLTMDEEPEGAKAPLAISDPIDEEKTRWSDRSGAVIRYRIGGLKYKNDVMTAMLEYVGLPGIVLALAFLVLKEPKRNVPPVAEGSLSLLVAFYKKNFKLLALKEPDHHRSDTNEHR